MKYSFVLMSFALTGCVTTAPPISLQPGAETVKIFRNDDPPVSCKEIKVVEVSHGNGCGGFGAPGNLEGAYNMFKNATISADGNAAILQSESPSGVMVGDCYKNDYTIRGVAFSCPASALQ